MIMTKIIVVIIMIDIIRSLSLNKISKMMSVMISI